jgi:hypothetical protein
MVNAACNALADRRKKKRRRTIMAHATANSGIPRIDPNVQYVGVTKLRTLNATNLQGLNKTLVIQDNEQPLAVVISYDKFLEMQSERERILATIEILTNKEESIALRAGLQDAIDGRTEPISAIRQEMKKK